MFRKQLTWRESGLISLVAAVATVTATYPGGWGRLPGDLLEYDTSRKLHAECSREQQELLAAVSTVNTRHEIQIACLERLVSEQLTLRQAAAELDQLFATGSAVRVGLRDRFPDATDAELMAVVVCYKVVDLPSADDRRIEQLHDEFRREYGKPLPPAKYPDVMTPESARAARSSRTG